MRQGASLAAVKYDPKGECLRRGLHFGYFTLAFIAVKQRVRCEEEHFVRDGVRLADRVPQAKNTSGTYTPKSRKKAKTLAQVAKDGMSTLSSVMAEDILMSSSFGMNDKGRRTAKVDRRRIAQKLSRARPDLADRQHSFRLAFEDPQLCIQGGADPVEDYVPSSSPATTAGHKFPDQLPMSDTHGCTDAPIDLNRSRQLAESFRAEFAKGRRPGIVVPRLSCLESQ